MKRFLLVTALVCTLGSFCYAELFGTGFGKIVTATTTIVQLTGFQANKVTVYNSSGADVFVTVDTTTNSLLAASVTNAIAIPSGVSFTFDTATKDVIFKLNYATTNSTAVLYIACF